MKDKVSMEEKVTLLIERTRELMPSYGFSPFTMLGLSEREMVGIADIFASMEPKLLVLQRIDFNRGDYVDYVVNSKEYGLVPEWSRKDFMEVQLKRVETEWSFEEWRRRVIGIGIGLMSKFAREIGSYLLPVEVGFDQLENHFGYRNNGLKLDSIYSLVKRPNL